MPNGVKITWFAHGTFGFESPNGVRIIVDPWFTGNPKVPEGTEPVADIILVTHGHGDHIGDVASVKGRSGDAQVVTKVELGTILGSRGIEDVVGFNTGGTVEVRGIRFTMTQAFHSSSVGDDAGLPVYAGEPAGFVVEFENGYRIYVSGDTTVFGDMALIGELYRPDIAILSIGDWYTMGPYAAAKAVELLGVKSVIGGHWGTFPILTGTPAALRDELGKRGLGDVVVHDLEPGDTLA